MAVAELPIGSIIAWQNASIPSGWALCDGQNGTPDLRDKFIYGAKDDAEVRQTGGGSSHSHTNSNTNSVASHNHGGSTGVSAGSGSSSILVTTGSGGSSASTGHSHSGSVTIYSGGSHNHTVPATDNESAVPQHVLRTFIRKNS